jgi:hypothetical protein
MALAFEIVGENLKPETIQQNFDLTAVEAASSQLDRKFAFDAVGEHYPTALKVGWKTRRDDSGSEGDTWENSSSEEDTWENTNLDEPPMPADDEFGTTASTAHRGRPTEGSRCSTRAHKATHSGDENAESKSWWHFPNILTRFASISAL